MTGRRLAAAALWLLRLSLPLAVGTAGCVRSAEAGRSPTSGGSSAPPSASAAVKRDGGTNRLTPGTERAARVLEVRELRQEMSKAQGQSLFVHLWATWCGPCLEELPLVDQFARTARARGAVVLSVSLDTDARGIARVPTVLRGRAPSLTPLVARFQDPEQLMGLFSSSWEGAIPALFAFDGAGKLQSSLIGEVEPKQLEALLGRITTR